MDHTLSATLNSQNFLYYHLLERKVEKQSDFKEIEFKTVLLLNFATSAPWQVRQCFYCD